MQTNRWSLEKYRDYLHVLARRTMGRQFQGKLDPSDVVHDALLKAHAHLDQFHGNAEVELKAWLRKILANNLANSMKALRTGKRNVILESTLAAVDDTSSRLERWVVAVVPSPSSEVLRGERVWWLAQALNKLPDDQRTALELRHIQGCSVEEICRAMARSEAAVAGLLRRGMKSLRSILTGERPAGPDLPQ
jgi:RNA polymerase sigma-70 factor (ECF subfamily)